MICMSDEDLVMDDWLMVLLVGIVFNIPMTRPSGDDVVVAEEMDSSHVELMGVIVATKGLESFSSCVDGRCYYCR